MNTDDLPPKHLAVCYTAAELRRFPERDPNQTSDAFLVDPYRATPDEYQYVVVPGLFPLVGTDADLVNFFGFRYDGSERDGLKPLFLVDAFNIMPDGFPQRLVPGPFDVEFFRAIHGTRASEPDGWHRFDGGVSDAKGGRPHLQLVIGVLHDMAPAKQFSLRLCYQEYWRSTSPTCDGGFVRGSWDDKRIR